MKKIIIRTLLAFFSLFLLYIIGVLVHGTATDFQPEAVIRLEADQNSEESLIQDSVLSFVSWNVGYGGLGAESDFFYDNGGMLFSGGKMVRATQPLVEKNIKASVDFMQTIQADFYLFQEVDVHSRRSYFINQYEQLKGNKPAFSAYFAINYKAPRVPLPILEPWNVMGKMQSGLASFAQFQPKAATRYQLPGDYAWPTRIFQLDRCILEQRFTLENGKELIVMNVHHSAYDKGGLLKKQQMAFLKELLLKEYQKANYIVVGGDWNQCPPYFAFDSFQPGTEEAYSQINVAPDYLPVDWRWVYDPRVPTNRKLADTYVKGETFTTLIDFFLISPNIKVLNVKGINQDFQFSDHQPIWMEVALQ